MFRLAIDYGYIEANPCRRVKLYKLDNARDRVLTPAEEERLLSHLTGKSSHLREIALLALYAGMRRGEVLNLEWHEVGFDRDLIHIPAEKSKNGKKRDLPMNQMVRAALWELRQSASEKASGRVFSEAYCTCNVSAYFSTFCKGIGLDDVTLHTLRHTFATRLNDAGVDPFTIRDLLGHKTIKMTDRYTHVSPDRMREAVKTLEKTESVSAASGF
jgi:integrase